jgi:hypothetical protein
LSEEQIDALLLDELADQDNVETETPVQGTGT